MSKQCVIIQGPTHDYERMRKAWDGFEVIYSTWEEEEGFGFQESDCVIYNKLPAEGGVGNINFQRVSTLAGLRKAEEKGYDFALKWRSDYVPRNPSKLFEMFDKEALNFIAWSEHRGILGKGTSPAPHGYLVDYFFASKTKFMLEIFESLEKLESEMPLVFPEWKITIAALKIKEKYDPNINYLLPKFNEENQCYFIREGKDFNSSCLKWQDDKYWQNTSTHNNSWPSI